VMRQPALDGTVRMALVIRLLQILLAIRLAPLVQPQQVAEQGA
jgi:hypothetical protein